MNRTVPSTMIPKLLVVCPCSSTTWPRWNVCNLAVVARISISSPVSLPKMRDCGWALRSSAATGESAQSDFDRGRTRCVLHSGSPLAARFAPLPTLAVFSVGKVVISALRAGVVKTVFSRNTYFGAFSSPEAPRGTGGRRRTDSFLVLTMLRRSSCQQGCKQE